jgi:hypothetical protein
MYLKSSAVQYSFKEHVPVWRLVICPGLFDSRPLTKPAFIFEFKNSFFFFHIQMFKNLFLFLVCQRGRPHKKIQPGSIPVATIRRSSGHPPVLRATSSSIDASGGQCDFFQHSGAIGFCIEKACIPFYAGYYNAGALLLHILYCGQIYYICEW